MKKLSKKLVKAALPELFINKDVLSEPVALTTVSNSKGATMEIPVDTLQDYVLQVFDKEPEKFIALKKFMHTCRKTKNCDCLGEALRIEHCARHDAITARNLADPKFTQRYGC